MTPPTHWYRLSVDLDAAGNPIGSSYEVRQDEATNWIHVLPIGDPFDTIQEVLARVLDDIVARYGMHPSLL